jgi:HAD superfamily hydrolase (TIGR01548 family)
MQDEHKAHGRHSILFDMDGVLINTSGSYDEATRATVSDYLCAVLGLEAPCAKPSHEILFAMKQAGGFNNDWDLTRAILLRVIQSLNLGPAPASPDDWSTQMPSTSCADVVNGANLLSFAKDVKEAGGGYEGARTLCGPEVESWLLGFGEVRGSNMVERIFQERYLGAEHFKSIYRTTPRYYEGPGFIEAEKAQFDRADLSRLSESVSLAVVTGRPRTEAMIGLEQFNLRDLFEVVVGLGDALHGKPHPAPVLRALKRLGLPDSFIYVGDMPDDLSAARAAAKESGVQCTVLGLCAGRPEDEAEMCARGFDEAYSDPALLAARLHEIVSLS